METIRDTWVKKFTLVPNWTFQRIISPAKCLLHAQLSASHPQVVVWCSPVAPSDASPVVISGEGWWRDFILRCTKFPGLQTVSQVLSCLHERERIMLSQSRERGQLLWFGSRDVADWEAGQSMGEGVFLQWSCLPGLWRFFRTQASCSSQPLLSAPAAPC